MGDKRYEYSKWKNDENLKKTLLKEREKVILDRKMSEIKSQIISEWNQITLEREYDKYLEATKNVKQKAQFEGSRWPDYGTEQDLINLFNTYSYDIKYKGTQEKLCQFIANFAINEEEKNIFS